MLPKLTEMERNSIKLIPYGFIKNLQQIYLREKHMNFTGKNKVGKTTWAKLRGLIGQKRQNRFQ